MKEIKSKQWIIADLENIAELLGVKGFGQKKAIEYENQRKELLNSK